MVLRTVSNQVSRLFFSSRYLEYVLRYTNSPIWLSGLFKSLYILKNFSDNKCSIYFLQSDISTYKVYYYAFIFNYHSLSMVLIQSTICCVHIIHKYNIYVKTKREQLSSLENIAVKLITITYGVILHSVKKPIQNEIHRLAKYNKKVYNW